MNKQTDERTEMRWLRRTEEVAVFTRKNWSITGNDMDKNKVPSFFAHPVFAL